jgi:hypothetical protein
MLSRLTKEFNKVYIDSAPLTGLQSIAASYELPYEDLKYLGSNTNNLSRAPIGLYVGALSLDAFLINYDPFIKYTGDIGANLKIDYNDNKFLMNSGYLAEYNFECAIGTIPTIATKWNIYNNFGSGISSSEPFNLDNSQLNIVNPGDISINFNEIENQKINQFSLNIKSSRLPIYDATNIRPVDVKLQYPLLITAAFSITLDDYKVKNLFDFPNKQNVYNFSVDLKKSNTNTIINTFNMNNALLIREDYSADVDGSILLQLTYSSTVHR